MGTGNSKTAFRGTALPLGPGRPGRRERRRAETREKIFRAALRLFAEHGFHAVTVEDITEAADVGKGTFFNYFPSKEHVLMTLGDIQVGKIEQGLAAARSGALPLRRLLEEFPRIMAEEPGRSPLVMRGLLGALLTSAPVRAMFLEKVAAGRKMLAELLALGQRRGEVRRDVPAAELARVVQQSFFGAMLMWSLDPSGKLARRFEKELDLLWSGMRARAKHS